MKLLFKDNGGFNGFYYAFWKKVLYCITAHYSSPNRKHKPLSFKIRQQSNYILPFEYEFKKELIKICCVLVADGIKDIGAPPNLFEFSQLSNQNWTVPLFSIWLFGEISKFYRLEWFILGTCRRKNCWHGWEVNVLLDLGARAEWSRLLSYKSEEMPKFRCRILAEKIIAIVFWLL